MRFLAAELPSGTAWAPALARRLLDESVPLHQVAVVVPASRAGTALQHALLEVSGRRALMLPAILTPARLVALAAERLRLPPPTLPDSLRAVALAARLREAPWIQDRGGAAEGLAEELVALLDELREHHLDPAALPPAGEDPTRRDHDHVRDAWHRYRSVVPRDRVDVAREVLAALSHPEQAGLALPPWRRLVVSGLVVLSPLTAEILRAAAARRGGTLLWLQQPAAASPSARAVLQATYRDPASPLHPGAPARRVRALLSDTAVPPAPPDERPLRERLAAAGPLDLTGGHGPVALLPADEPEAESRLAAHLVVERLREEPKSCVMVATADRSLGRRIAAQLRDAGLDVDDSGGLPLASHADGRLAHALVRCVLTGWNAGALLELITHPHVSCGLGRESWLAWARRYEAEVLRGQVAAASPSGHRRRAKEKDRQLGHPFFAPPLASLRRALAPLAHRREEPLPVGERVAALREAWAAAVAPRAPWPDDDPARTALNRVLDELAAAQEALPPVTLADFAALLRRQLLRTVLRPHRRPWLPVRVTGLLEARLEWADLLVLAGMNQEVFPGRLPRPLLLGARWRRDHGLPGWPERLGWNAELAWRLLGGGRRVAVTWSLQREGRPAPPSPWIARLLLAADTPPATATAIPLHRRRRPDLPDLAARQAAFAAEPPVSRSPVPIAMPETLSPSAIDDFLACPYRFLLSRRLGLREPESVIDRLEKRDVGTLVHEALRRFLADGSPARRALADQDRDAAGAVLRRALTEVFQQAGDLPERALWQRYFHNLADEIVEFELRRWPDWRPAHQEVEFRFTLAQVAELVPAPERPDPHLPWLRTEVHGRIDRLDLSPDGQRVAVLDYKTGRVPGKGEMARGERQQLAVYALAVGVGGIQATPAPPARVVEADYCRLAPGALVTTRAGHRRQPALLLAGDALQRCAANLLETAAAMAAACTGGFSLARSDSPFRAPPACAWCRLRGICRRDERDPALLVTGESK